MAVESDTFTVLSTLSLHSAFAYGAYSILMVFKVKSFTMWEKLEW